MPLYRVKVADRESGLEDARTYNVDSPEEARALADGEGWLTGDIALLPPQGKPKRRWRGPLAVGLVVLLVGALAAGGWWQLQKKRSVAPATVSGGMWVTMKLGNSNILRGAEVRLMPLKVQNRYLTGGISGAGLVAEYAKKRNERVVEEVLKKTKDRTKVEEEAKKWLLKTEDYLTVTKALLALDLRDKAEPVDASTLDVMFAALLELINDARSHEWSKEDADAMLKWAASNMKALEFYKNARYVATSDVDGKYMFAEVAPGQYCVVARVESVNWLLAWRMPIEVLPGQPLRLDLHNDNANEVSNKND